MEGNAVTLQEAGLMLEAVLKACPSVRDDDENVRKMEVLIGHAGEGKTAMIDQVLARLGCEKAVFHMGSTVEEDNNGLPYIDRATGTTKLAKPEHVPCFYREPNSPSKMGVLVIEECLSGGTMHQNFLRSVIDRRWPDGTQMKPGWKIIGTTNPETAEYSTVKSADRALATRMRFINVRASVQEKLEFWSGRMQETIYNFLATHSANGNLACFVNVLDSRSWYGLADDVERMLVAGLPHHLLARAVRTAAGPIVEAAFFQYLKTGSDPECYPINAAVLLYGDKYLNSPDKDVCGESLARIRRWAKSEEVAASGDKVKTKIPLLGATNWAVKSFITRAPIVARMRDDAAFEKIITKNLIEFMTILGESDIYELPEDLCVAIGRIRETYPELEKAILKSISATPLGEKLWEIHSNYQTTRFNSEISAVTVS